MFDTQRKHMKKHSLRAEQCKQVPITTGENFRNRLETYLAELEQDHAKDDKKEKNKHGRKKHKKIKHRAYSPDSDEGNGYDSLSDVGFNAAENSLDLSDERRCLSKLNGKMSIVSDMSGIGPLRTPSNFGSRLSLSECRISVENADDSAAPQRRRSEAQTPTTVPLDYVEQTRMLLASIATGGNLDAPSTLSDLGIGSKRASARNSVFEMPASSSKHNSVSQMPASSLRSVALPEKAASAGLPPPVVLDSRPSSQNTIRMPDGSKCNPRISSPAQEEDLKVDSGTVVVKGGKGFVRNDVSSSWAEISHSNNPSRNASRNASQNPSRNGSRRNSLGEKAGDMDETKVLGEDEQGNVVRFNDLTNLSHLTIQAEPDSDDEEVATRRASVIPQDMASVATSLSKAMLEKSRAALEQQLTASKQEQQASSAFPTDQSRRISVSSSNQARRVSSLSVLESQAARGPGSRRSLLELHGPGSRRASGVALLELGPGSRRCSVAVSVNSRDQSRNQSRRESESLPLSRRSSIASVNSFRESMSALANCRRESKSGESKSDEYRRDSMSARRFSVSNPGQGDSGERRSSIVIPDSRRLSLPQFSHDGHRRMSVSHDGHRRMSVAIMPTVLDTEERLDEEVSDEDDENSKQSKCLSKTPSASHGAEEDSVQLHSEKGSEDDGTKELVSGCVQVRLSDTVNTTATGSHSEKSLTPEESEKVNEGNAKGETATPVPAIMSLADIAFTRELDVEKVMKEYTDASTRADDESTEDPSMTTTVSQPVLSSKMLHARETVRDFAQSGMDMQGLARGLARTSAASSAISGAMISDKKRPQSKTWRSLELPEKLSYARRPMRSYPNTPLSIAWFEQGDECFLFVGLLSFPTLLKIVPPKHHEPDKPGRFNTLPIDACRVLLADQTCHQIWLVNSQTKMKRLLAGCGKRGFLDGPLEVCRMHSPCSMTLDPRSHYIYVADTGNHMIRKIDLLSGLVSTVVGCGARGNCDGDDPKRQVLDSPFEVSFAEPHHLIISCADNSIRSFNLETGYLDTILVGA
jgi:hypothetical protein